MSTSPCRARGIMNIAIMHKKMERDLYCWMLLLLLLLLLLSLLLS